MTYIPIQKRKTKILVWTSSTNLFISTFLKFRICTEQSLDPDTLFDPSILFKTKFTSTVRTVVMVLFPSPSISLHTSAVLERLLLTTMVPSAPIETLSTATVKAGSTALSSWQVSPFTLAWSNYLIRTWIVFRARFLKWNLSKVYDFLGLYSTAPHHFWSKLEFSHRILEIRCPLRKKLSEQKSAKPPRPYISTHVYLSHLSLRTRTFMLAHLDKYNDRYPLTDTQRARYACSSCTVLFNFPSVVFTTPAERMLTPQLSK